MIRPTTVTAEPERNHMDLIGYAEIPISVEPVHWDPAPDECLSCGVTLVPGTAGNVACCDFHDQTCDSCDADLIHLNGRTA